MSFELQFNQSLIYQKFFSPKREILNDIMTLYLQFAEMPKGYSGLQKIF
jgi:hypothetical protein